MQDNYNESFNDHNQWEDHSWARMQELLDKEMPVTAAAVPPRNKWMPLGMLLLLLFGFSAGVGSVLLWQKKGEKDLTVGEEDKPVAINESSEANSSNIAEPNNLFSTTSNLQQSNNTSTTADNTYKQNTGSQLSNVKATNSNQNIQSPFNSNLSYLNDSEITYPSITSIYTKTLIQQGLSVNVKGTEENTNYTYAALDVDPAAFPLFKLSDDDKALAKILRPSQKTLKVNWSWLAGLHNEAGKGFGGYSTGLVVDLEVDKRFGLATGLIYSKYQFNDITLNNSPSNFDLNHSDGSAPGISNDVLEVPFTERSSSSEFKSLPLGSASFIAIPVMLTYKPFKKMRINMGVEYARMLGASADKLNSSNYDYKSSYKILDNSSSYGSLLNKTNFSAIFGLSYLPEGAFGFDLRYNHGFSDLSKSNNQLVQQNDTRESLQFSLLYRFGNGNAVK